MFVTVPVLANGDFFSRRQIDEYWKHCRGAGAPGGVDASAVGPTGVMVARGAMWNPSFI